MIPFYLHLSVLQAYVLAMVMVAVIDTRKRAGLIRTCMSPL